MDHDQKPSAFIKVKNTGGLEFGKSSSSPNRPIKSAMVSSPHERRPRLLVGYMMLHGIQKLKNNCLTEGARLADGMPIIWKRRIPSSQDISRLRLCCGKLKMDDGFVTFHPNGIHIDLGICKTWQDMNSLAALGV